MRVAIRRTLRVGKRAGAPVEDLGVVPNHRHLLTKDDLLNGNVDLINKACELLAALPQRTLQVDVQTNSPTAVTVGVDAVGMDRIDVYRNERPAHSTELQAGKATFSLSKTSGAATLLEIQGFDGSQLVARLRTSV
jgi:hypothetical protein